MLNTDENIKESKKIWNELFEESGVTDESAMTHEYDYLDDED